MQIIKKTAVFRTILQPPRPTPLQVPNHCEWGKLNQIFGHSTKYQSGIENSTMS